MSYLFEEQVITVTINSELSIRKVEPFEVYEVGS